jgi:hypothetical protein
MATFSLWEGEECGISLVRGASPPTFATGEPMDPGSVRIKQFEAASGRSELPIVRSISETTPGFLPGSFPQG